MNQRYAATSFEVEAERRREVLASTMRASRRSRRPVDDFEPGIGSTAAPSRGARHAGLVGLAIGLAGRMVQRI
jgi:hypothetical protein